MDNFIGDDCAKIFDDILELIIEPLTGEGQQIKMNSSSTLDDLSREISQVFNTPQDFRISLEKKQKYFSCEGQKTLEACGISHNRTIYFTRSLRGGRGDFNPVAFSSLTKHLEVEFSSSAPPGRIIQKGLSLEGKCQSNRCCRYQYKVIVHKGFGEFNMNRQVHNTRCPLCENKTKDNFAPYFYQCKFIIEGLKDGQTDEFKLEGVQTGLKSCKTFKSERLDNSDWEWLVIKVITL